MKLLTELEKKCGKASPENTLNPIPFHCGSGGGALADYSIWSVPITTVGINF
jgi:hypothetical protein